MCLPSLEGFTSSEGGHKGRPYILKTDVSRSSGAAQFPFVGKGLENLLDLFGGYVMSRSAAGGRCRIRSPDPGSSVRVSIRQIAPFLNSIFRPPDPRSR